MAESILVTGKKISSMELVTNVTGNEKIPTGQPDDLALTPNQIADHTITRGDLASQEDLSQVEVSLGTQITDLANDVNSSDNSIRGLIAAEEAARIAADNLKVDKEGSVSSVAGRVGDVVLTPSDVLVGGFGSQEDVNKYVPKTFLSGYTYGLGERVVLDSGEVVKSFVNGNVGNPNVDMTGWVSTVSDSLSGTIQTFNTPEAGVDPVTGVADGAYFNVRSTEDESYGDEYQNVGGVATSTGKSYPSSQVVSAIDSKLNRENVSVWDFFTQPELNAYKSSPNTFDAYRPIQEFFDYTRLNDVGTAFANGSFSVSSGIKMGQAGSSLTKRFSGYLRIKALSPIDTVVDFQLGGKAIWDGGILVTGTGGYAFSSRTCRVGIAVGNNADRVNIGYLEAQYFTEIGVRFYNKTTMSNIQTVRALDCGSGYDSGGSIDYSLRTGFEVSSNTGAANTVSQQTVLTVDTLPPDTLQTRCFVVINNEIYYVANVDRNAKTLSVYPWVDTAQTSGSLRYIFGAGVDIFGGDSSVLNIGTMDLFRNGVGYSARALYGANVGNVCAQANGLAVLIGSAPDGAMLGGLIGELYVEINNFDLVGLSRATTNFNILRTIALNKDKIKFVSARGSDGSFAPAYQGLFGITIEEQSRIKRPRNNATSVERVTLGTARRHFSYKAVNIAFNLEMDIRDNQLFGYDDCFITVFSGLATNLPTQITFNPDTGRTVNGLASQVFTDFTAVPQFFVVFDVANNNYIVRLLSGIPTTQTAVTYDPPSIEAGATEITTVTLQGASVGGIVQAAFSRYNANIEISAQVSAANTVTVKFKNTGATAVDLASGTLTVKLV